MSEMRFSVSRAFSHIAPVTVSQRRHRQAALAEAGSMQIEPRDAEPLADLRPSRRAVFSSSAAPSSSESRPPR